MSSHQTKLESYLIGFVAFIAISLMTVTTGAQEAPIVIAHRGACGYLPEHTLEAASMAHAMHVDFIEQDVVLTKDNVPVVLHDIQLDTVTDVAKKFPDRAREDGRFYAIDFSLAEIKQLSVHERISLKTGQAVFPKRFDVSKSLFRVPTLTDEIELIQGLNAVTNRDVGIYVEIKKPAWHREQGKDISKIVLDALAQHGYKMKKDNAYLQCFDPSETRRIREDLHSELKLVQLIGDNGWNEADTDFDQLRTQAGIVKIAKYADGIGPWMPHILEPVDNAPPKQTNLVLWAHESGMVVHPFTFRKDSLPDYADSFEALMQLFFQQNIDGLFTDFPELAVQFKGKFKPKPKTKAALDAKSLSKWMMTYYQDPKPEQFVEAVRVLSKINKLNDTSPNAKTDVSLMFLGKIIENNPKQVPDWMDALSDLPKQDYSAIKRALWFAGTDPALDWLRNHGDSKLADGPRPLLLSSRAAMPTQPYHVDQLWGWYFATGDPEPVYRIAALFSLAYAMPPEDNSKLLSPPVKGSDEGLYQVQQYNFTLLNPALWSCASLAIQDDKVLATLVAAKEIQKSDRSKAWIERVIEIATTRRQIQKDSKKRPSTGSTSLREAFQASLVKAEQGDDESQLKIGQMYEDGTGVPQDKQEAFRWYLKAAEQGNTFAQTKLGVAYMNGAGVDKDVIEAASWYRKAATQGDSNAQNNLGLIYANGNGVEKDEREAFRWFQKSADQGNPMGQRQLGLAYINGSGVKKNDSKAASWFRQAAEKGDAKGQFHFALMYADGTGIEADQREAVRWFLKAAAQGEARAQNNLGVAYLNGTGVEKDEAEAIAWFQKSAKNSNPVAQRILGLAYANGTGVQKDAAEAVNWLRKAANKGDAMAQGNLGLMYVKGLGVQQDRLEAAHWFSKAAQQGDPVAKANLELLQTIPQNQAMQ